MKTFKTIAITLCLTLLAGCGLQTKIDTDLSHAFSKVQTPTVADIENAKLGAAALPPPTNTEVTNCLNDVEAYMASIAAALAPPPAGTAPSTAFNPKQIGVATGFVDGLSIGDPKDLLPVIPKPSHQMIVDLAVCRADAEVEAQALLAKFGLDAATLADLAKNPAAAQALLPIKP